MKDQDLHIETLITEAATQLGFTKAGKLLVSTFDWNTNPVMTLDYSAIIQMGVFSKQAEVRTCFFDFRRSWISPHFKTWVRNNAIGFGLANKIIFVTESGK